MKKMRTVMLSLLMLLSITVVAQDKGKKVYSIASDGYVNMREEPSSNGFVMDLLYTGGEGATYLGKQGKWYHVEYGGQKGYVYAPNATCSSTKPKVKKLQRKLYYVVVGSFETLEAAKKAVEDMPDALLSPVYRAEENGQVKYRICAGCFLSKNKARQEQKSINECFSRDSWIWAHMGFAECVYRPGSLYDGTIPIPPLAPGK